jgi:ABC-type glutathione transport system ATPase component
MEGESKIPSGPIEPLLRVRGLSKEYVQHRWLSKRSFVVRAFENIEFTLRRGSTLALVGESGSGKSTLARCVARLEQPTSGEIWLEGKNLLTLSRTEMFRVRTRVQMIFQDAAAAMNPRLSALEIVAEPFRVQQRFSKNDRRVRAIELMELVGLPGEWQDKLPLELSGGQRQRLTIARALALAPALLILDEALTGLDLSIQAQIVNLLLNLQESLALSYLFISHDLAIVSHFADEVAVIHQGKIVEQSASAELFSHPRDTYTRSLIDRFNPTGPFEGGD